MENLRKGGINVKKKIDKCVWGGGKRCKYEDCFVILPQRYVDNKLDVLVYRKTFNILNKVLSFIKFNDEFKSFEKGDIKFFSVNNDIVDIKWGNRILEKYGEENHLLCGEDKMMYLVYTSLFLEKYYYANLIQLEEMVGEVDKEKLEKLLFEFMKKNNYEIVIPPISKHAMNVSWNRLSELKKTFRINNKHRYYKCLFYKIVLNNKKLVIYKKLYHVKLKIVKPYIYKYFNNKAIVNVKELKLDGAGSCALFFRGDYKGKKVFIKAYAMNNTIKNEEYILKTIKKKSNFSSFVDYIDECSSKNIIVYPYCEEGTLILLLSKRELNDRERSLFSKFLDSLLDMLKQNNIQHGDIKPDNIMITYQDGEINGFKITDFGWSSHNGHSIYKKGFYYRYEYWNIGGEYRYSLYGVDDNKAIAKLRKDICDGK